MSQLFPLFYTGPEENKTMLYPRRIVFERQEGAEHAVAKVSLEDGNQLVQRWPELFRWPEGFGQGHLTPGAPGVSASEFEELKQQHEALGERFESLLRSYESFLPIVERLRVKADELEARLEALAGGEQTPPPKIDPSNPLEEVEAIQAPDTLAAADPQPQAPPADTPKRGRPKSTPTDTPKE